MSLTQKVLDALSAAGLSGGAYSISSSGLDGVIVKSKTDDYDAVVAARDAVEQALPASEYVVMFARSITDPNIVVRPRPAGF